jgi:protein TonB
LIKIKIIITSLALISLIANYSIAQNEALINKDTTKAEFPGGIAKFHKYLFKTLKLDSLISNSDATINWPEKLYVSFVILEDGKVSEVKLLRNLDQYVEAEIRRVMLNSPTWTPGNFQGKPVKTKYVIPITIHYK